MLIIRKISLLFIVFSKSLPPVCVSIYEEKSLVIHFDNFIMPIEKMQYPNNALKSTKIMDFTRHYYTENRLLSLTEEFIHNTII